MNPCAKHAILGGAFRLPYIIKLSVSRQPELTRAVCCLGLYRQFGTRRTHSCHTSSSRDDLWTLSNPSPSYTTRSSVPGTLRSAKVEYLLSNRAVSFVNRIAFYSSTSSHGTSTSRSAATKSDTSEKGDFEVVYRGPLRSAVRAVKIFSLTTCAAALVGGPILVTLGNPSVPLLGRVLMTSVVMLIGISTTLILHWLMKGYVIEMHFDPKSEHLRAYTLTMLAGKRRHTFHLSDAGPPENIAAFSTFQANGKSFFMHSEVMENKELLGRILGPYMALEDDKLWKTSNTQKKDTL